MSASMLRRVSVLAARQLGEAERSGVQDAIPQSIAGLLAVQPGAAIRLSIGSDAEGLGVLSVEADGQSGVDVAFAAELAAELDQAFVTELLPVIPNTQDSWMLRGTLSSPAGFAPTSTTSRQWAPNEAAAAEVRVQAMAWLSLACQYPGLMLEMQARFESEPNDRYEITVSIRWSGAALPLRARSVARLMFPSLTVDARSGGTPAPILTDVAGARALLQLPVCGSGTLPGVPVATARPIPVLPVHGEVENSTIRLGSAPLPSGKAASIFLTRAEQTRHQHIIGQTGTGKSSLLSAILNGYAQSDNGCLLIDPHGHLGRRFLAELPESARERVWYIEAGDIDNPVPMNPFAIDDPVQLDIVIQDTILIFYKLFDPRQTGIVGPRFEGFLTNALRGLRALRGSRASLLDVPRVYRDPKFERAVADAVTDPLHAEFWRGEMRGMSDSSRSEIIGWVTSKFDRFTNTAAMRGILASGADAFDPAVAMDEGRIIILDLSKGRLGDVASNLLGFLYLTRFWSSFPARTSTSPFGIIVDEAQSFSAGSLPAMLSEGRKWGASVTIAHQYLSQLELPLLEALSGNVATTVAFRTGRADAVEVAARMGGSLGEADLTAQPDLQALISRTSGAALPRPHSLMVDHGSRVAQRSGAELEEFIESVRAQTRLDLVEPHRGAEAFTVSPPRRVATPAPEGREQFLDEWMRHRAAMAAEARDEEAS